MRIHATLEKPSVVRPIKELRSNAQCAKLIPDSQRFADLLCLGFQSLLPDRHAIDLTQIAKT